MYQQIRSVSVSKRLVNYFRDDGFGFEGRLRERKRGGEREKEREHAITHTLTHTHKIRIYVTELANECVVGTQHKLNKMRVQMMRDAVNLAAIWANQWLGSWLEFDSHSTCPTKCVMPHASDKTYAYGLHGRRSAPAHAAQDINFGISIKWHRQMTSVFIIGRILFAGELFHFCAHKYDIFTCTLYTRANAISMFPVAFDERRHSSSQFQFKIKLIQFFGGFVVQDNSFRADNVIFPQSTHRDTKLIPLLFARRWANESHWLNSLSKFMRILYAVA